MLAVQTEFLISLFVLLACAIVAGEVALRLGQLALVGQLLVGVVLGPTLLGPYLDLSTVSPQLSAVQLLATFFLLFLVGLETGPNQFYKMEARTAGLGLAVFFVPFALLLPVVHAVAPGLGWPTVALVAVTLAITALPVMAVMIREFGLSDREFGRSVMGAALVNELCAVTVFAFLLQLRTSGAAGDLPSLATALVATGLFLAVVFAAYYALKVAHASASVRATSERFSRTVRSQEAGFALLVALSLGAALLSQYLGLTFVIGAFYAGILITPESVGPKLHDALRKTLHVFMWGLFIPLFFAITGVQTNFSLIASGSALGVFAVLLSAAVLTKVGTGTVGARLSGWGGPDSAALGFLVNCRGAVEIAMAVILYGDGLLSTFWFTIVVGVGLVCTVVAPVGAVAAWRSTPASRADLLARAPHLALRGSFLAPTEDSLDPVAPPGAT